MPCGQFTTVPRAACPTGDREIFSEGSQCIWIWNWSSLENVSIHINWSLECHSPSQFQKATPPLNFTAVQNGKRFRKTRSHENTNLLKQSAVNLFYLLQARFHVCNLRKFLLVYISSLLILDFTSLFNQRNHRCWRGRTLKEILSCQKRVLSDIAGINQSSTKDARMRALAEGNFTMFEDGLI